MGWLSDLSLVELSEKLNTRELHKVVPTNSSTPLDILEGSVKQCVAGRQ